MDACFCCVDPSLPAMTAPVRFGSIADILGALAEKEPKDRKEKFYKHCLIALFDITAKTILFSL